MQQNNKQRKKIIILALILIIVIILILTASTYAWFTANRTVSVNEININVTSSDGLQISADGLNWKAIISNDDIKTAHTNYLTSTNQIPSGQSSLIPVSTIGEVDTLTGFMKMYSGIIEGSSIDGSLILSAKKSTETEGNTGDFVVFDVFLQVSVPTQIYLTSNSKVTVTNDKVSTGIENAARVAFINEGTAAIGSTIGTIQNMQSGTKAIIWEPNYDAHTASGITNAMNNYGKTVTNGGEIDTIYGVKTEISKDLNIPLTTNNGAYVSQVIPDIKTRVSGIPITSYEPLVNLNAGITKLRIYMWIEGQDVDCEDNASGGSITYSLQFSSNDKS